MDTTSNFNTYTSQQYTPRTTSSSSSDLFMNPEPLLMFALLIGMAIFILWIASMIAMINLNSRFKEFYELHTRDSRHETTTSGESQVPTRSKVIEPLKEPRPKADLSIGRGTKIFLAIGIFAIIALIIVANMV